METKNSFLRTNDDIQMFGYFSLLLVLTLSMFIACRFYMNVVSTNPLFLLAPIGIMVIEGIRGLIANVLPGNKRWFFRLLMDEILLDYILRCLEIILITAFAISLISNNGFQAGCQFFIYIGLVTSAIFILIWLVGSFRNTCQYIKEKKIEISCKKACESVDRDSSRLLMSKREKLFLVVIGVILALLIVFTIWWPKIFWGIFWCGLFIGAITSRIKNS